MKKDYEIIERDPVRRALKLEADKILDKGRKRKERAREKEVKALVEEEANRILTEDEIKQGLSFTAEDIQALNAIARAPDNVPARRDIRNAIAQMQALKLKAQYTLAQPKQELGVDGGVQIVVKSLRDVYELPKAATDATLPMLRGGEEDDAEQV